MSCMFSSANTVYANFTDFSNVADSV